MTPGSATKSRGKTLTPLALWIRSFVQRSDPSPRPSCLLDFDPLFGPVLPHLKIDSTNGDGSVTVIESMPCEAGSSVEFCIVEVRSSRPRRRHRVGVGWQIK